jgi:hypothetical protein
MRTLLTHILSVLAFAGTPFVQSSAFSAPADGHYLYVATPGIRNYLEYGGHGLLVFDIEHDYRFVRRIATGGLDAAGKPSNVKGVCASATTGRIYLSTLTSLLCLDLITEKLLWERNYEGGCDRMSLTPDGKEIYLPSLEKDHWNVVNGENGDVLRRIEIQAGAHNTICGLDGKEVYLAGLRSPYLRVAATTKRQIVREVGPFTQPIRPFTVNGAQSLVFVNVNELLGFEIGDLRSGKSMHRVEVSGFSKGAVKRHGCPSHGIGLTPDEREVWVCDAHNQRMHVFDATVMPPKQVASLPVRDEPGWVTFRLDGRHAWPSTGDIIDIATRKTVAQLTDEENRPVMSEKIVEIHFRGGKPVRTGDQFGLGRVQR